MAADGGHRGNAETLRRYWAEGEGAARIRWGTPGDWQRCVDEVNRFMPGRAKGYCNLLHKRALGYYPATHAKMAASHTASDLLEASVTLGIAQPDVLALGIWDEALHPRIPAGTPGGGKFAPKGSGGGGKGGKGAGKGGKAKGKGGGKAKTAAQKKAEKAAQDAQTQQKLNQLAQMTPQQRAAELAKLTDPQVKALAAMAARGNSEDPAVKALRTSLADELAKRSLTGAKGPSQINAEKAARAKDAAGRKSAAASKRAATAKTAAAKRDASAKIRAQKQTTAAAAKAERAKATAARQQTAAAKRAQLTTLRQQLAVTTDKAKAAALRMQIRRVLAGLPAVASPGLIAASHVALASPSVMSGDGPSVTMTASKRRAYAKSGVACPDGSFPIPDKAHLRKAVKAIGRAAPAKRGAVRAHIRKRAKALGVALPDAVR